MRYTAIQDGHRAIVAAISGDDLIPLTEVGDFYRNLPQWTTSALPGRPSVPLTDVVQVPAVTPDARILCIGLNYRAHAAEGGLKATLSNRLTRRWVGDVAKRHREEKSR